MTIDIRGRRFATAVLTKSFAAAVEPSDAGSIVAAGSVGLVQGPPYPQTAARFDNWQFYTY